MNIHLKQKVVMVMERTVTTDWVFSLIFWDYAWLGPVVECIGQVRRPATTTLEQRFRGQLRTQPVQRHESQMRLIV